MTTQFVPIQEQQGLLRLTAQIIVNHYYGYSEPLCFGFFLTAPKFLLIFNSTSLNKRKDLEDCLVFLLQAIKTHICIYQCLERTWGNAWVVATQCTDKISELSALKVHNATEKSKLGTDYGWGAAQTFTQGVITQEQSLKLQLSMKEAGCFSIADKKLWVPQLLKHHRVQHSDMSSIQCFICMYKNWKDPQFFWDRKSVV